MARVARWLLLVSLLLWGQSTFAGWIDNYSPTVNDRFVDGTNPNPQFLGSPFDFSAVSSNQNATLIAPHFYITVDHINDSPPSTVNFTNSAGATVAVDRVGGARLSDNVVLDQPNVQVPGTPDIYIGMLDPTVDLSKGGITSIPIIDAQVSYDPATHVFSSPLQGNPFLMYGNQVANGVYGGSSNTVGTNRLDPTTFDQGQLATGIAPLLVAGNTTQYSTLDYTFSYNPGSTLHEDYLLVGDSGAPDLLPTSGSTLGILGLNEATESNNYPPSPGWVSASVLLSPYQSAINSTIHDLVDQYNTAHPGEPKMAYETVTLAMGLPGLVPVPEPTSVVLIVWGSVGGLLGLAARNRPSRWRKGGG